MSPLWCRPGNILGFILDGKSYRQGEATAQTPTVPTVSGVRITTLSLRTCNLTTIACGRWSPDSDLVKKLGAPLAHSNSWRHA